MPQSNTCLLPPISCPHRCKRQEKIKKQRSVLDLLLRMTLPALQLTGLQEPYSHRKTASRYFSKHTGNVLLYPNPANNIQRNKDRIWILKNNNNQAIASSRQKQCCQPYTNFVLNVFIMPLMLWCSQMGFSPSIFSPIYPVFLRQWSFRTFSVAALSTPFFLIFISKYVFIAL